MDAANAARTSALRVHSVADSYSCVRRFTMTCFIDVCYGLTARARCWPGPGGDLLWNSSMADLGGETILESRFRRPWDARGVGDRAWRNLGLRRPRGYETPGRMVWYAFPRFALCIAIRTFHFNLSSMPFNSAYLIWSKHAIVWLRDRSVGRHERSRYYLPFLFIFPQLIAAITPLATQTSQRLNALRCATSGGVAVLRRVQVVGSPLLLE